MTRRARVLVIYPRIAHGGGDAVTAWLLEALCERYDVCLGCLAIPDYSQVNMRFGTSLQEDNIVHFVMPRWMQHIRLPFQHSGYLLLHALLSRFAHMLARDHTIDLFISTFNETGLPSPAIQYVHAPSFGPLHNDDWKPFRWYQKIPGVMQGYKQLIYLIGGSSLRTINQNTTLVNSAFTARQYAALFDSPSEIIYPPVSGTAIPSPWMDKKDQIVCSGRFSPEKQHFLVLDLIAQVRATGHLLDLIFVGTTGDASAYVAALEEHCLPHADWVTIYKDVERPHLLSILNESRYGIHALREETFGIAVAEMQRAGSIVFVPDKTGPAEIVGDEPHQVYATPSDAIHKIVHVLKTVDLQKTLHIRARSRASLYTTTRFMNEMQDIVARCLSEEAC